MKWLGNRVVSKMAATLYSRCLSLFIGVFVPEVWNNLFSPYYQQGHRFHLIMEATDTFSLDVAKTSFLSLLSSTDPSEVGNFMDWVIKHCSSVSSDDGTKDSANQCDEALLMPGDKRMKKIIKDIKKRIPLDGIMSSENIYHPEGKVILEWPI